MRTSKLGAIAALTIAAATLPLTATIAASATTPLASAAGNAVTLTNADPAEALGSVQGVGTAERTVDVTARGKIADVDISITTDTDHASCAAGAPIDSGGSHGHEMFYVLTSPSGTRVVLINSRDYPPTRSIPKTYDEGYAGTDTFTVDLDDEAGTIVGGNGPSSGRFRPASPLSAFDGEETAGTWSLTIGDDEYWGGPTCHKSFTLTVTPEAAPASIVVDGGPADGATVTEAPTYRFYSTGGGSKDCRVDGGRWEQCSSPYTVPIDGLEDGAHTVEFRAIGSDGSLGQPVKRTFVLDAVPDDTTGPSVTIDSGPADGATVDTAPAYGFSSPDDDVAGYECSVDDAAYAACESPFTPAVDEPGAHSVAVRATDTSGNTGQAVTRTFTLRDVACDDATAALEAAQGDLADTRADVQDAKEKLREARESGNPVRIDRAKERLATAKEVRGQAKAAVAAAQADVDDAC